MKNFDVVIVGAGPAGSATAISLAQKDYKVALVDKQLFPREKICGDFVNPINWPVLRQLGVEQHLLSEAHYRVAGFRITSMAGESAETSLSPSDQIGSYGLGLMRSRLDHVLLRRASAAGAIIKTGCRLLVVSKTSSAWRLATNTGEILNAKILVGADGRNSWLGHRLRMNRQSGLRSRFVGFQMRLHCQNAADDKVEIHLFPGGYAGLINIGEGMATLGLSIDKKLLPNRDLKASLLQERLAKNPFLRKTIQRCKSIEGLRSAYPVYFQKRRSFAEAVLLVGDAARVTEPVSGEGIYFALTSGMLAANTIDHALRKGNLSEGFLSEYERECQHVFRSRILLNSLLRFAVYRPALLTRLIHWSAINNRLLSTIVDRVCARPECADEFQ